LTCSDCVIPIKSSVSKIVGEEWAWTTQRQYDCLYIKLKMCCGETKKMLQLQIKKGFRSMLTTYVLG